MDDIRKGADNYEDGRSDISETADTVGDVAVKAMETGIELGEKAKETMDIAWDGFKETTKNVKDTVVGNDDDPSPVSLSDDRDNVDSHVHKLRKRGGGYDLQDK